VETCRFACAEGLPPSKSSENPSVQEIPCMKKAQQPFHDSNILPFTASHIRLSYIPK
jgi:hypothetical protein